MAGSMLGDVIKNDVLAMRARRNNSLERQHSKARFKRLIKPKDAFDEMLVTALSLVDLHITDEEVKNLMPLIHTDLDGAPGLTPMALATWLELHIDN